MKQRETKTAFTIKQIFDRWWVSLSPGQKDFFYEYPKEIDKHFNVYLQSLQTSIFDKGLSYGRSKP